MPTRLKPAIASGAPSMNSTRSTEPTYPWSTMIVPSRSRRIPGREHDILALDIETPSRARTVFNETSPGRRASTYGHSEHRRLAQEAPVSWDMSAEGGAVIHDGRPDTAMAQRPPALARPRYDDLGLLTVTSLAFALGASSAEGTKHLIPAQAGILAGIGRLPDPRTLRPRLAAIADSCDPLAPPRPIGRAHG